MPLVYCGDGAIEIDNSEAERSAEIYFSIGTAKLSGVATGGLATPCARALRRPSMHHFLPWHRTTLIVLD